LRRLLASPCLSAWFPADGLSGNLAN
jgi:hypothetical protein